MQQEHLADFLNDDCWGDLLDHASRNDLPYLEELEGTCRARLRIETITNVWDEDEEQHRRKCRILVIKDIVDLNTGLQKWGRLVAELYYDARQADERILRNLGSKCPNLEDITFVRLKWHSSTCDWAKNFMKLKRICFENCSILDSCVSELIKNNNIEELVFRMTDTITGSFLLPGDGGEGGGDLTKLNTLILSRCSDLKLKDLQSAVEPVNYLAEVRKLELRDLPPAIHKEAHLVLEKMPQLEQLTFDCTEDLLRADAVRALSQLGRLQVLGWLNGEVLRGDEIQTALKHWLSKPTIVDVLNQDCWGLVLRFLRTEDIVRSERVSRGWQRVVLRYLQDAPLSIVEYPWCGRETTRKYRCLKMNTNNLASSTAKWGPRVKKAECMLTEANLRVLLTDCPNLEDVKFHGSLPAFFMLGWDLETEGVSSDARRGTHALLRAKQAIHTLAGMLCQAKQITKGKSPYQLRFTASERSTWQCPASPLSNMLRSLCLERCGGLELRYLLSAVELTELRKLIIASNEIFPNLHLWLDKLPHLEELSLQWDRHVVMSGELSESLGRLRLRRLAAAGATDAWLAAAARGFGQLAELHLEGSPDVTAREVLAACGAAGGALRELNIASNHDIEDRHVEEILRTCPNLERLNVSCRRLTKGMAARAGAARAAAAGAAQPRRLLLTVRDTVLPARWNSVTTPVLDKYPWLHLKYVNVSWPILDNI